MKLFRVTDMGACLVGFHEPHEMSKRCGGEYAKNGYPEGTLLVYLGAFVRTGFKLNSIYPTSYQWVSVLAPDGQVCWVATGPGTDFVYLKEVG